MITPNSHNARVLHALASGKWVTSAEIERRAGSVRLPSRISELRKRGFQIDHRVVPGAKGKLAHKYKLVNPPPKSEIEGLFTVALTGIDRGSVPRDKAHRFRIYRMVFDEIDLVATAEDAASLGEAIISLGESDVFSHSCIGILDTKGSAGTKGTWIINPWDTSP